MKCEVCGQDAEMVFMHFRCVTAVCCECFAALFEGVCLPLVEEHYDDIPEALFPVLQPVQG